MENFCRMKKIALDIEGTIANIHTLFIESHNSNYGANFSIEDITNWDVGSTRLGVTSGDFLESVKKLWYENWENIQPTEKDLDKKLELLFNLHKLDIVTNCVTLDDADKRLLGKDNLLKWLKKYNIPYHNFVPLGMNNNKADLSYDYFIDDNPILAKEIESNGKFIFLYDRPWNKEIKESKYIKRVHGFSEIINFLKI